MPIAAAYIFPDAYAYINRAIQPESDSGAVPIDYSYPPGNVLRYGTNSVPGTTDMTVAIQAAVNQASYGGPRAYAPAGRYGISSDITLPCANRDINGGTQYAADLYGDGMNQTYIEFLSGGSFTNGIYMNGGATPHLAGKISDLSINAAGHAAQALTLSYTDVACVSKVIVRGSTGRGIYVNNAIMTRLEQCYVVSNGSSTLGQIEIDGTNIATTGANTTTTLDQVYVSGGNANTLASLLIDRSNNIIVLGGALESSGVGVMIGSKATTFGMNGITFVGTDFENCNDHYVEAGYGLSGGAYVANLEMRNCTGFPSGATSIIYGVKLSFVSNAYFSNNSWGLVGSPVASYWCEGANPLRITIQPHGAAYGGTVPWVFSGGSQVLAATPLVEFDLQETPARPFISNLAIAPAATTIANTLNAQGGYYQRCSLTSVGAVNVTAMTGNALATGALVFIRGDGNSTLVYGTGANAFQNKSGANLLTVNNVWYQYMYNGAAWVQLGT
jgi:hypothetical protein